MFESQYFCIIFIGILCLFFTGGWNLGHFKPEWCQKDTNLQPFRWSAEALVNSPGIGQQSTSHVLWWTDQWVRQRLMFPMCVLVEEVGRRWSHHHLYHPPAQRQAFWDVWSREYEARKLNCKLKILSYWLLSLYC